MKRTKPVHGDGTGAITPGFFTEAPRAPKPKPTELAWLKQLLASERRRHGQTERILTRTISVLETQLADMREIYVASLGLKPTEATR